MILQIFIDADACPVKEEAVRVAERYSLDVYFVANSFMRLPASEFVKRIVVGDKFDEADDWIAERAGGGDIVVTADIPLAARCIETGATVIGPTGKPFTKASIGMALAMRELMSDLRAMGEVSGGNAAFSKQDRSRFLQAMDTAVQAILRRAV